jgi:hypothetical protein
MKISEGFWNASLEDMKKGFIEEQDNYTCLLCGKQIEKGVIYPVGKVLYEARKYMTKHIEDEHGSVFEFLNRQDKKLTGLSEHQSKLLGLFYEGKSDSEVQSEMGIGSTSTIRNHRFALKEKEKQSRAFLVMMELLKEKNQKGATMISPHRTATMVDDRYNITEDESAKILDKYFPNGVKGKLTTFSMKEKNKLVVLREIIKRFEIGRIYSEKELNEILKGIYEEDYVVIRRYLIEYGFMDRKKDCSEYWVKEDAMKEKTNRKEIISQYKQTKKDAGVYRIINNMTGKYFLSSCLDINGEGNKFEFAKSTNTPGFSARKLANVLEKQGFNDFSFEVLELLDIKPEMTDAQVKEEIKLLEEIWREKLGTENEY